MEIKTMIFHYARVSTNDQNLSRQIQEVKCDRLYCDKQSGKNVNREQLQAMMANIREDDEITCLSMDRLSRSLADLIKLVEEITTKGAKITFQKENMTFTPNKKDPFQNSKRAVITFTVSGTSYEIIKIIENNMLKETSLSQYLKDMFHLKEKMKLRETNVSALAREFGVSRCLLYQLAKN